MLPCIIFARYRVAQSAASSSGFRSMPLARLPWNILSSLSFFRSFSSALLITSLTIRLDCRCSSLRNRSLLHEGEHWFGSMVSFELILHLVSISVCLLCKARTGRNRLGQATLCCQLYPQAHIRRSPGLFAALCECRRGDRVGSRVASRS